MFENVLVGVNGTSGSQDAIALASALTASEGKLTIANVHPGALILSSYVPVFDPDENISRLIGASQLTGTDRRLTAVDPRSASLRPTTTSGTGGAVVRAREGVSVEFGRAQFRAVKGHPNRTAVCIGRRATSETLLTTRGDRQCPQP
jgi:hypothetical protein